MVVGVPTLDVVLTQLMDQHRWAVAELAAASGIPVRTLENWRSGEVARPRHVADLLKVATALGLSVHEVELLLAVAQHSPLATLTAQAHQAGDLPRLTILARWVALPPPIHYCPGDPLAQLLGVLPEGLQLAVRRMIEEYRTLFGGRAAALAALDRWLASGARPYAFMHAPIGCGKTALLIHWALQLQAQGNWTIIFVPISLRYGTATELLVLTALSTALARVYQASATTEAAGIAPDQLRQQIAASLRRTLPPGQRLLLILDGLDEAIGWQVGSLLFPAAPPPGLRILVAAREKAGTSLAHWYAQLSWDMRSVADFSLAGLDLDAISALLAQLDAAEAPWVDDPDMPTALFRISAGDPLTVRFLVDALHAGTFVPSCLAAVPPGLVAYLEHWLSDLRRQSFHTAAVYVLLALCALAHGPLTAADLAALAPEHFARGVDVQLAVAAVDRFIIGDGSDDHGYRFSHARLRDLFGDRVLTPQERGAFHARFVTYGQRWYAERTTPPSSYVRRFWLAHLIDGGHWAQVRQVLTEVVWCGNRPVQPWSAARMVAEGNATGYLADLDQLWTHAEAVNDVVTSLHCALIASTLHSLSSQLPPNLLAGLVAVGTPEGQWTLENALAHIRQMPTIQQQAHALRALTTIAPANQRAYLLDQAMQLPLHLDTISESSRPVATPQHVELWRAAVLQHLAATLREHVLEAARTFTDPVAQVQVLVAVALRQSPKVRGPVYAEALAALARTSDSQTQTAILLTLAPHLPEETLPLAQALPDAAARSRVLAALVPQLTPARQVAVATDVLAACDQVADCHAWVQLLTALAPVVPEQVLLLAQAIPEGWARAAVYVALAPHNLQAALVAIEDDPTVEVLVAVAPSAPDLVLTHVQQQGTAWEQAQVLMALAPYRQEAVLELVQAMADTGLRLQVLSKLAAVLPTPKGTAMAAEVVRSIQRVTDPKVQVEILRRLLPYQPNMVWAAARTLDQQSARLDVFLMLASTLPPTVRPILYAEALAATRHIGDSLAWSAVLCALGPHIPAPVLVAVAQLPDVRAQVRVLTALAPYLPEGVLDMAAQLGYTNVDLAPLEHNRELPDVVMAAGPQVHAGYTRNASPPNMPVGDGRWDCNVCTGVGTHDGLVEQPTLAQAEVLLALAPQQPIATLVQARQLADPLARARVLTAVAPHLPVGAQRARYAEALAAATAVAPSAERMAVLRELAPHLAAQLAHPAWHTTLRAAATQGRCSLLNDLAALMPWLCALTTPDQQAAIVAAMRNVWSCWP